MNITIFLREHWTLRVYILLCFLMDSFCIRTVHLPSEDLMQFSREWFLIRRQQKQSLFLSGCHLLLTGYAAIPPWITGEVCITMSTLLWNRLKVDTVLKMGWTSISSWIWGFSTMEGILHDIFGTGRKRCLDLKWLPEAWLSAHAVTGWCRDFRVWGIKEWIQVLHSEYPRSHFLSVTADTNWWNLLLYIRDSILVKYFAAFKLPE